MVRLTPLLSREFYCRPTLTVARALIGAFLVHRQGTHVRVGRIVETEAYQGPHDLAAHSAKGRTPRTEVMFGPPGHAYVYLIYGVWNCLNVVVGAPGVPHAVLLRALEPIEAVLDKTWGPGLLCKALDIDRGLNGADFCGPTLQIHARKSGKPPAIAQAPRIGVDYAGTWAAKPWRFYAKDSPFVSTARGAAVARARARALYPIRSGASQSAPCTHNS